MRLPEFDFLEPRSVAEACALLAEEPRRSALFAGGTDVLVDLKAGLARYKRLVSLRRIEPLRQIAFSEKGGLSIGSMATVNQVARHETVRRRYPGVVDAAHCLAADQVRNLATVGGNLCSAVPSADMAPIMLAHGAKLRVVSPAGERVVPLGRFFVGPRATVLEPAEVLVAIELPPPGPGEGAANLRQGGRLSLSLPVASVAAVVAMDGALCRKAALAVGAVAPTPILAPSVGEFLGGKRLTDEVLAEAGRLAAAETRPIDDVRSSKEYRLEAVAVLTGRTLKRAAERVGGKVV
jgi:carbon-monoxide dehydrogenase medium subunit